jgi:hypothetical protein
MKRDCRIRKAEIEKKKNDKEVNSVTGSSTGGIDFWASMATIIDDESTESNNTEIEQMPEFLLDSGATHHLTPHRYPLSNIVKLDVPIHFGLADSTNRMTAVEKGDILIKMPSGQGIQLQHVYHIPGAPRNVVSAGVLRACGWKIDYDGRSLHRKNEMIKLKDQGVLNFVRFGTVILQETVAATVEMAGALETEHYRLGHIGRQRILETTRRCPTIIGGTANPWTAQNASSATLQPS